MTRISLICFCIYLSFIFIWILFSLFFLSPFYFPFIPFYPLYSFLSFIFLFILFIPFYPFYSFLWTCLLGGFVCTISSYFCYMGVHDHVTQLLLYSPIIHIFILKSSTIGMVHSQNAGMWTDNWFSLNESFLFLAGILTTLCFIEQL